MQHLADGKVLLPWSNSYKDEAEKFVDLFVSSVSYALGIFNGTSHLLGYMLNFYDLYFTAATMPKFILEPIHNQMLLLSWSCTDWMTPTHIESFYRLLQQYLPNCHWFVGKIFLQVNWTAWLGKNVDNWDYPMRTRIIEEFLWMVFKLSHEPDLRKVS